MFVTMEYGKSIDKINLMAVLPSSNLLIVETLLNGALFLFTFSYFK